MLDPIRDLIMVVMDTLLAGLLALPKDGTLLVVAGATAGLLSVVRMFTTNQNLLKRCHFDKKRLRALAAQARKAKTKNVVSRCKQIKNMIAKKTLKQEVLPLMVSIIPIICIATWCFERLGFHPPGNKEDVEVVAYFRVSQVGQLVHLVPEDGLSVAKGWVKEIEVAQAADGQPYGLASWIVRGTARAQTYPLVFRYAGKQYEHELLVGQ